MTLEEIADTEALVELMGCFYSDAEKYHSILEQIIQTVHSHTLAVEMSARLLETGIMEPMLLLNKLEEEKAGLDATDTIGISGRLFANWMKLRDMNIVNDLIEKGSNCWSSSDLYLTMTAFLRLRTMRYFLLKWDIRILDFLL